MRIIQERNPDDYGRRLEQENVIDMWKPDYFFEQRTVKMTK